MHNILINCPFACLLYPAMPCFLFKLKKTLSISWLSWKKLFKMPGIPRFIGYSIRRDVFVSHWIKVSLCIDSLLLFFSLCLSLMSLKTFNFYIYFDINFTILNLRVFFTIVHQFLWDISARCPGISSLQCQQEHRWKRFVVTHDSLSKTKLYLLDTKSGLFNILWLESQNKAWPSFSIQIWLLVFAELAGSLLA